MAKAEEIFDLLYEINNKIAEQELTVRESVRLYLSLITMAFTKAGATKEMIPFILKEVGEYLSERLKEQLK